MKVGYYLNTLAKAEKISPSENKQNQTNYPSPLKAVGRLPKFELSNL
jgi:hypothetical protein